MSGTFSLGPLCSVIRAAVRMGCFAKRPWDRVWVSVGDMVLMYSVLWLVLTCAVIMVSMRLCDVSPSFWKGFLWVVMGRGVLGFLIHFARVVLSSDWLSESSVGSKFCSHAAAYVRASIPQSIWPICGGTVMGVIGRVQVLSGVLM